MAGRMDCELWLGHKTGWTTSQRLHPGPDPSLSRP